jgi:hypothetical protein
MCAALIAMLWWSEPAAVAWRQAAVIGCAAVWLGLASPHGFAPAELARAWSTSRQWRLLEDVDYGQWGLVLLSPAASAQRTAEERARRPAACRVDDVVIGEFLGDQELVRRPPFAS